MSTISSPRSSIVSSRGQSPAPSSHRPSTDTLNTNTGAGLSASSTPSTARASSPSLQPPRRNRAALRDYYNLKPSAAENNGATPRRSRSVPRHTDAGDISSPSVIVTGTELDSPDFDAQKYVEQLLANSSLSTVLKAENSLVGDVRTLDSERKALVYDNYSKLIRAVETIGKMRRSMDDQGAPLKMTKTLGPAIGFVAETAGGLIQEGEEQRRHMKESKATGSNKNRNAEKETVKWVLGAPARLEGLLADGKKEDAEKEWAEVKDLLDKWEGVKGAAEIKEACENSMKEDSGS